MLASAGLVELADETRVRGAVEHYYAIVADVAKEFTDPVARLQALCGELMEIDDQGGLPKTTQLDEVTRRELQAFLLNHVKPQVAAILAVQRSGPSATPAQPSGGRA